MIYWFQVEYNRGILLGVTSLDIPMDDIQNALRSWKVCFELKDFDFGAKINYLAGSDVFGES